MTGQSPSVPRHYYSPFRCARRVVSASIGVTSWKWCGGRLVVIVCACDQLLDALAVIW